MAPAELKGEPTHPLRSLARRDKEKEQLYSQRLDDTRRHSQSLKNGFIGFKIKEI